MTKNHIYVTKERVRIRLIVMTEKKRIKTADGTFSLMLENLKETYHSRHGALQESRYVYIEKGLKHWKEFNPHATECHVFEMGFGTGLNALLAADFAQQHTLPLYFESIENDPLSSEVHEQLGYTALFPHLGSTKERAELLQNAWNREFPFSAYFNCFKKKQDYFQWQSKSEFDLIFYDAFGAHAQSEMWEEKALQIAVAKLKKGGVWVSYCAKGSVRRALQSLGLEVERLPGPPGKREMLRATKL